MRYTEKEYNIEVKNILDFYRATLSQIIGAPLRMVVEISLKVPFFDKKFNTKILIGACLIAASNMFVISFLMILLGSFSFLDGSFPMIYRLLGLVILIAFTYAYNSSTNNFSLTRSNSAPRENKVNFDIKENAISVEDTVSYEKLNIKEPFSQEEVPIIKQSSSKRRSLDIQEELTELANLADKDFGSSYGPLSNDLFTDLSEDSFNDLKLDIPAIKELGISMDFLPEDVVFDSDIAKEFSVNSDAHQDSIQDGELTEEQAATFSDTADISINYEAYYSADIKAYTQAKYFINKNKYYSKQSPYSIEEIQKIEKNVSTMYENPSNFSQIAEELFCDNSFEDLWSLL